MSDPITELFKLKSFQCAFWLPITVSVVTALYTICSSDLKFQLGYVGLNNAIEIFKVPLMLLALIIPSTALVIANHRSSQSKEQIQASLRQNELSVKPVLSDRLFTENGMVIFRIQNKGLGTAHIKSVQVFCDNTAVENAVFSKTIYKKLIIHSDNRSIALPINDSYLSKDEPYDIIKLQPKDRNSFEAIKKIINEIDILIKYESLFGEKYTYRSSSYKEPVIKPETSGAS